jgi:hypothetical protein
MGACMDRHTEKVKLESGEWRDIKKEKYKRGK